MTLIERLTAIPYTGALSDILDEMGYRHQVLPPAIQALEPRQTMAGRALTVSGRPQSGRERDDYFRPYLTVLGAVEPGDVIVSQPHDSTVSHFGELSAEAAKMRGGRGVVIDGGIRDVDYIVKLGFPTFARYKTPKDIVGRWILEEFNVPIVIGDVRIAPGDYIVGDADGVLVIPQAIAEKAIATAEEVVRTESLVRKAVMEGVKPLEAYEKFGRF